MRGDLFRAAAVLALFLTVALASGPAPAEAAPRFNTLRVVPEGAVPPKDFAFPDLDGKTVRLSAFRGKVVLLAFFATWCPLCNVEMPKLTRLQKKYAGRGFTVLAVSIDRLGPGFVRKWTVRKKLNYPVLHDRDYASRRSHNVRFVPTLYLLDRNLNLAAWAIGGADWEGKRASALFERLLGQKVAAAPPARRP